MSRNYYTFIVAVSLLLAGGLSPLHAESAWDDENFSATVWFTSDYVFRGVSLSDEDPAVQASLDWSYNNFYVGVWGTNLELEGSDETGDGPSDPYSSVEYDFYAGYVGAVGPLDYDFTLVYYWYPNDRGNLEADVFEVWLTLGHIFENLALSPSLSLFGAWTPDATLEDGDGIYGKVSLSLTLSDNWGLDAGIGVVDVEGDKASPDGYGYTHYEAGLSGEVKGFGLDFRYHNTNKQKSVAGDDDGIYSSRFVFTIARSF